jgi:hypothetical protein
MAPQRPVERALMSGAVACMVELHDRLGERGHRLRYLGPDGASTRAGDIRALADAVEAARPGSTLRVPVHTAADEYDIMWPRDGIQRYGDLVAIAGGGVERSIAAQLGFAAPRLSVLAEGGLVLRAGPQLVVSSALGPFADELRLLHDHYRLHCLPAPRERTHLDLDLGLSESSTGRPLLLVGEPYRCAHAQALDAVAAALAAEQVIVPRREVEARALNFIELGNGDVVMPAGCPRTERALAERKRPGQVLTVEIVACFGYNGGDGGLRCMSTVLDTSTDPRSRREGPAGSRPAMARKRPRAPGPDFGGLPPAGATPRG